MQHFLPHILSETEADPQTKIFGHHCGGRPHPVAVLNPAIPSPSKSNTGKANISGERYKVKSWLLIERVKTVKPYRSGAATRPVGRR